MSNGKFSVPWHSARRFYSSKRILKQTKDGWALSAGNEQRDSSWIQQQCSKIVRSIPFKLCLLLACFYSILSIVYRANVAANWRKTLCKLKHLAYFESMIP